MAKLIGDLIKCGRRMQDAPKGAERIKAFQQYTELREDIRDEAKALTKAADSTQGFEALQMSLSLSNQYQDLINSLNSCESAEELESLQQQVDSQTSVFKHRAKKLEQLLCSVSSTMQARADVSAVAEQLKHTNIQSENDCDF